MTNANGYEISKGDYVTIRTKRCGSEVVEARYVVGTIAWDDAEEGDGQSDRVIVRDGEAGDHDADVETIDAADVVGVYGSAKAAQSAAEQA